MNKDHKRQALIGVLKKLTPEMKKVLQEQKEFQKELGRPDFIWHFLLQSFSTMGNSRGYEGLIKNKRNYNRVSFKSISKLSPQARLNRFDEVFRVAKLRMPTRKAKWLNDNYDIIKSLGGLKEAKRKAFAQKGTDAKIKFMKQFAGIGKKYARNIWMDVYHIDFHNTIAIDERIRQITNALGYAFPSYEDHEKFYLEIAKEANLQGWELDRLLYNFKDFFLKAL